MANTAPAPLDSTQAKRFARWLHENGASEIQLVESYPHGGTTVKYQNRVGTARVIRSHADFIEARDFWGH